jgi:GT2 family glycosyltransferase
MSARPELSVVITLDRNAPPPEVLFKGFAAQTEPMTAHELVIVDAMHAPHCGYESALGSLPGDLVERVPYRFFRIEKAGRARGVNFAIAQAKGQYILCWGDDFIPQPQAVAAHLRFHRQHAGERLIGIGPALFPFALRRDPFSRWLEDSGQLFGVSFTRPNTEELKGFFYGANTSFKGKFLRGTGLLDEIFPFHTTDDWEFGCRLKALGAEFVFLADARAIHEHGDIITVRERKRAMWETGYSAALLAQRDQPALRPVAAESRRQRWRQNIKELACQGLYLISRRAQFRHAYWSQTLERSYLEGYRAAQTAERLRPQEDDCS